MIEADVAVQIISVKCSLGLNSFHCVRVPSCAGYEALDDEEASWGEAEGNSELDTPNASLSRGSMAASWAHEARHMTQETNGRSHHQPDLDCHPSIPTSALLLEKPEGSISVSGSHLSSTSALKAE